MLQQTNFLLEAQKTSEIKFKIQKQYDVRRKQFEVKAQQKINEVVKDFNLINSKLNQKLLTFSSYLVAIYQAMHKINQIYKPQHDQEFMKDHKEIQASVGQQQMLNEIQCNQILIYSMSTIKMLENIIRSNELDSNQKFDFYEDKIHQLMIKFDYLKEQKDLKYAIQQFSKTEITEPKQRQSTDFIDQLHLSFNKIIARIALFVEEQSKNSIDSFNISREKQESQKKLKNENQKVVKEKEKEDQINKLKGQILDLQSKLQAKQKSNKQLAVELAKRDEEIKVISKFNFQRNKAYEEQYSKHEKKVKQLSELVSKVTNQLKSTWQQKKILHQTKSEVPQNNHLLSQPKQSFTKEQIQSLKHQLKQKQEELIKANNEIKQLRLKVQELQTTQNLKETNDQRETFQKLQNQLTQKDVAIVQLQQQAKSVKLEVEISKKKYQDLEQTKNKQIAFLKEQFQAKFHQSNSFINQLIDAWSSKVNKKVTKEELIAEITAYKPPVGMKLIYSSIFLGQDTQRQQTIQLCEQFAGKKIKKTERLGRFPDTTSIVHQVPKQNNNFPFIMLYKTSKGTVFGSFSLKLKQPTFFFSFSSDFKREVKQWLPADQSVDCPSVDFVQGKFIQYGSGELKINCIDMKTISGNSGIKGYFNLDWKQITNESNESKIALGEVEVHKVEFDE